MKQGDAPNEVTNLTSTFMVEDNKVSVYSALKIVEYDPVKYIHGEKDYYLSNTLGEDLLSFPVQCVRKFNDCYFVEGFTENMRFAIYDKNNIPKIYRDYSQIIDGPLEKVAQVMSYASKIEFRPDRKYWVQASYIGGVLEIFHLENDDIVPVKQLFIYPPVYTDLGTGVTWGHETTIGVDDLYATSDHINVVLNGTKGSNLKSNSPVNPFSNKILVLDWQGNLVRKIETDCMIMTLAVDVSEQYCYMISYEAEKGYDLRKISL